jgi:hypothetical protein
MVFSCSLAIAVRSKFFVAAKRAKQEEKVTVVVSGEVLELQATADRHVERYTQRRTPKVGRVTGEEYS